MFLGRVVDANASDQGLSTQPLADGVNCQPSHVRGEVTEAEFSHACSVGLQMETGVARPGELWTVDCLGV